MLRWIEPKRIHSSLKAHTHHHHDLHTLIIPQYIANLDPTLNLPFQLFRMNDDSNEKLNYQKKYSLPAMTKVRTISKLLMKLICAALPIRLSMFLNSIKNTVRGCRNWHPAWWWILWPLTRCYPPCRSVLSLASLACDSPKYSPRAFGSGLSSKERRDPDERPGRLPFWTITNLAFGRVCRGRFLKPFRGLAWSSAWWRCTSSWHSRTTDLHLLV